MSKKLREALRDAINAYKDSLKYDGWCADTGLQPEDHAAVAKWEAALAASEPLLADRINATIQAALTQFTTEQVKRELDNIRQCCPSGSRPTRLHAAIVGAYERLNLDLNPLWDGNTRRDWPEAK